VLRCSISRAVCMEVSIGCRVERLLLSLSLSLSLCRCASRSSEMRVSSIFDTLDGTKGIEQGAISASSGGGHGVGVVVVVVVLTLSPLGLEDGDPVKTKENRSY